VTAAAPVLRARGVAVARTGVEVVRGADVDLRAGEVVVVIGRNGAGKSTLLLALGGLLPLGRGEVERHGRVAAALQAPALARRTARANVEAALQWWGVPRTERRERALAALAAIGARHLAERPAGALSGGEARRVHLARALALGADALLLDEPFAGLDQSARKWLEGRLETFKAGGGALLMATHSFGRELGISDRLAILAGGRVALDTPRAGLDPQDVQRLYTAHTEELS
jgi:ABC-type Mn2+/Zn2+ transport system ATPase subunit